MPDPAPTHDRGIETDDADSGRMVIVNRAIAHETRGNCDSHLPRKVGEATTGTDVITAPPPTMRSRMTSTPAMISGPVNAPRFDRSVKGDPWINVILDVSILAEGNGPVQ
jgi:hypothetical protein